MAHQITVDIAKDGKLTTEFDGFAGDQCYQESDRLKDALAVYGLNVDVEHVTPKEREEVAPLRSTQRVGSGG